MSEPIPPSTSEKITSTNPLEPLPLDETLGSEKSLLTEEEVGGNLGAALVGRSNGDEGGDVLLESDEEERNRRNMDEVEKVGANKDEDTDELMNENRGDGGLFSDDQEDEEIEEDVDSDELMIPDSQVMHELQQPISSIATPAVYDQQQQRFGTARLGVQESGAIQNIETKSVWERPRLACDRKYFPAKIPASLHVDFKPFNEVAERRRLLRSSSSSSETLDLDHTLRYRIKTNPEDGKTAIIDDKSGFPVHESNARLVQWSDGSWTLAIGHKTHYECVFQNDKSVILDETNPDLFISHGMATEKITFRPLSTSGAHLNVAGARPRDSGTIRLTNTLDSLNADASNRRRLEKQKELRAQRAKQKVTTGTVQKKLDARFLEDETEPSIASTSSLTSSLSRGRKS